MNGDLKTTFVQQVLAQYMLECIDAITIAAKRNKVEHTGEGIRSLAYVMMNTSNSQGVANLKFHEYLRFIDMGVSRGHPLGGMKSMKETLKQPTNSKLDKKIGVRKARKIYSPIVYGKLTWLQNQLLYGYTEEVIQQLKNNLNGTATN